MSRARLVLLSAGLSVCTLLVGNILGYDRFSIDRDDTNCHACHVGIGHDEHQLVVSNECYPCHRWDNFPVYTNWSLISNGLDPIGCIGCHGRAEDGTGVGTQGYGMGLRQHHWRRGETVCLDCHNDASPANATPVGEHVLPPHYANPGTGHPEIPYDSCSPAPDYPETFPVNPLPGLDNDGDLSYDEADPDCSGASAPGETAGPAYDRLIVLDHDGSTSTLELSFGVACECTENVIEYGDLHAVSTYAYAGQVCSIGTVGSYSWSYPASPSSLFFLVVGRNAAAEGSYGLDGQLAERPEDSSNIDCPLPQNLVGRCD